MRTFRKVFHFRKLNSDLQNISKLSFVISVLPPVLTPYQHQQPIQFHGAVPQNTLKLPFSPIESEGFFWRWTKTNFGTLTATTSV